MPRLRVGSPDEPRSSKLRSSCVSPTRSPPPGASPTHVPIPPWDLPLKLLVLLRASIHECSLWGPLDGLSVGISGCENGAGVDGVSLHFLKIFMSLKSGRPPQAEAGCCGGCGLLWPVRWWVGAYPTGEIARFRWQQSGTARKAGLVISCGGLHATLDAAISMKVFIIYDCCRLSALPWGYSGRFEIWRLSSYF